jgi:transposase
VFPNLRCCASGSACSARTAGGRIKAVNNKDRNFTRRSLEKFIKAGDERLADYLQRLEGRRRGTGDGRRAGEKSRAED